MDLSTASEFVIVGKAFSKESIRTVATIDKFIHNYLIDRKDRGIDTVENLKGKRIGLPLKTAPEFYLGKFMELNGMNINQVILVDLAPTQIVDALLNGDVDAVVVWQPNATTLEDRLGDEIVVWRVQNEQATYCSLISHAAWTDGHPDLIKRFLQSLAQAEAFYIRQPAEAQAIIQWRLGYSEEYITTIWREHEFQLSFDQSFILALEDEARWMIKNNLTSEMQTPDFLD